MPMTFMLTISTKRIMTRRADDPPLIDSRESRRRKQRHGLLLHMQIFLGVNIFLWGLYYLFPPVQVPDIFRDDPLALLVQFWPLSIAIPWGFAIALQWFTYRMVNSKHDEQQVIYALEHALAQRDNHYKHQNLILTDDGELIADDTSTGSKSEGPRYG